MATRHRVLLGLVCAALLSIAPGCCTTALWAGAFDARQAGARSVDTSGGSSGDHEAEVSDPLWWHVALTPPAVLLDVVTLPLQLVFFLFLAPAC